ncbi:ubiquitin carboxyl-terminal hydrolase MINDY-3-like isoform X2 [Xenia sp. Carnegie-2017]|uniref:ubiquitin carboxyl-terminal hydrolase MINDY-3-like isoform X2 n=1 Tax=Xenia sp. Carnegie-2017 TaxID=2897299 RepID=UPI001F046FD6|nr:ubiquitin carboxyl-terminal hydrolase MINDY-3-like isoform X2 [Xenia sp. Carnegie-2017]
MAVSRSNTPQLSDVFLLTWSVETKHDVFERWSQGFYFSDDEPTALVQNCGGPCSVIASVQAYLVRRLIFERKGCSENDDWRKINGKERKAVLCQTLIDIWKLVAEKDYQVVLTKNHQINEGNENQPMEIVQTVGESSIQGEKTSQSTREDYHKNICSQTTAQTKDDFHSTLRQFSCCKSEHLENFITRNIHQFEGTFGVLLFLYSILLSKGIKEIKSEMDETVASPLIDPIHGHGSQSMVNLMLTGHAVSHVWDLERDVGGLKLKGIPKQSNIGFLSLLESMRYCEVGSFLKCPKHPIWLLASETHLTVLLTKENIDRNRPVDIARSVFKTYDTQENGFIEREKLKDVLEALELETEPDYVGFMQNYLDPDSSGIILLHAFQMFYPEELDARRVGLCKKFSCLSL